MFGVHIGIKYKDPSDRTKGGEFNLKVDDMKRLFPRAHSKAIDVYAEFDGGDNNRDGLFDMKLTYKLTHGDGDGDEQGNLMFSRKMEGGLWKTALKTSTFGKLGGPTIIPSAISNMDWKLESDRQTKLNFQYLNPSRSRNFKINVDRVPGKEAHVHIVNGDRKHDLTFKVKDFDLKNVDGNFEIQVEGTSLGESVDGSITGEANSKGNRIKINFERGNKKVVQIDAKIKKNIPALYFETKTKYSLLGGVMQGTFKLKFNKNQLQLENEMGGDKLEIRVMAIPGVTLEMECKKNGEQMWFYKTNRTTVDTPEKFEMDVETDMKLSSNSMLWAFLDRAYPYGAFNVRKNTLHVFVDRQNYNKLLPKFFIDAKLYKEGEQVVTLEIDSRNTPYKFLFIAPNVFARWNIPYDKIEATLAHDIGKSIDFQTNVGGGIEIHGNRGPNDKGGRDINILTKKAGKQMMKIDISTEKQVDDDKILLRLHDSVEIDADSALFRRVVSNYRFLTPFNKRTGEYEIFVNKKDRNVIFSKFYVKGQVVKDGEKAMNLLITTAEKPYKVELYMPAILNKIYSDMNEYKMSIDHEPGTKLVVKTNGKKFTGFSIAKTGSGNEREIIINGKKLGSGDYTLTDNSFSTKITNSEGDWLQPKVTWEGALPKNPAEAEAFFLKNNVKVDATGSKRNFNMNLSWKMTRPDWDLNTPESAKLQFNWKGKGPRWGDYSIERTVSCDIANKVLEFNVDGESHMTMGRLATDTPIKTKIALKYFMDKRDLVGLLQKIVNGKEYSVNFPEGTGVMPSIKWGQ